MNGGKDIEARMADLEIHAAHQEETITELSETVAGQWETINTLSRKVEQLQERFFIMEEEVQSFRPDDRPPPHY